MENTYRALIEHVGAAVIPVSTQIFFIYPTLFSPSLQASNRSHARAKCFSTLDAYCRLIALLVRHSGDASNSVTKINLLTRVGSIGRVIKIKMYSVIPVSLSIQPSLSRTVYVISHNGAIFVPIAKCEPIALHFPANAVNHICQEENSIPVLSDCLLLHDRLVLTAVYFRCLELSCRFYFKITRCESKIFIN